MRAKRALWRRPRGQRGSVFVQAMMGGMLLSIAVMGMVRLWSFAYQVTNSTDDNAIAYNLGRQTLEKAKRVGFHQLPEGSSFAYYTGGQSLAAGSSGARFVVMMSVASNPGWPNNKAIRVVRITVTRLRPSATLYSTSTILVRAGV